MDIFSQKIIADLEAKLEQALIYGRSMRTELDSANERGQLALSLAREAFLKEIRAQDEAILQLRAELEAEKAKGKPETTAMGPVAEMPICAAPEVNNTRDDPPSLVPEINKKIITITVLEGQDLIPNDRITGYRKAYVSVYVHEVNKIIKRNTKKVRSFGVNPHWDEELNFEGVNPETTSVVFKVKTSETFRNTEILGWTKIDMKQLFEKNLLVHPVPLQNASDPNACLLVKIGMQDYVSTPPESPEPLSGLRKLFNCCLAGSK
jgi:hypothetical protein